MKKIVKVFAVLTLFNIAFSSCKEKTLDISVDKNLAQKNINSESMITSAENKLGKLVKTEKEFIDIKSGSTITMVFAAKEESIIKDFFTKNSIYFKGVDLIGKNKILEDKNIKPSSKIVNQKDIQDTEDYFDAEQVYYDLKSVKLRGDDVGYGFSIIPKLKSVNNSIGKNLRPNTISWCQQTSLPWCEVATVFMDANPTPSTHELYSQSRGIFWGGAGIPIAYVTANGSWYSFGIDGPKYTRFGGDNPLVQYMHHITWYDLESGQSVSQ